MVEYQKPKVVLTVAILMVLYIIGYLLGLSSLIEYNKIQQIKSKFSFLIVFFKSYETKKCIA